MLNNYVNISYAILLQIFMKRDLTLVFINFKYMKTLKYSEHNPIKKKYYCSKICLKCKKIFKLGLNTWQRRSFTTHG